MSGKRKGPCWDNHIMRKFGQSIREKIAEAFVPYAMALVIVRREKVLDELVRDLDEDAVVQ